MDVDDQPDTAIAADVSVIEWPLEQALRQQLAAFELPRVLLVAADQQPPELMDALEDWMWVPANAIELTARCRALSRRRTDRGAAGRPTLDEDGLLWVGRSWVALSAAQAPVARLLLDNLDKVVRFETVVNVCETAGGSGNVTSVRTLLARLRGRVQPLGLELLSVRRRGVLLTAHHSHGSITPGPPVAR